MVAGDRAEVKAVMKGRRGTPVMLKIFPSLTVEAETGTQIIM